MMLLEGHEYEKYRICDRQGHNRSYFRLNVILQIYKLVNYSWMDGNKRTTFHCFASCRGNYSGARWRIDACFRL